MKKPWAGLAALALLVIAGGTAMAQGRVVGGAYHRGAGTIDAGGRAWHGGGYYGGGRGYYGWHGYRGGWGGAYWGPGVGIYLGGPAYWAGWPYAYGYPYGYGYAPYVNFALAGPTVYVEQQVEAAAPPAQYAPDPPPAGGNAGSPPTFWFYCTKPAGYYPYVRDCSNAWLRVVPQANTGTTNRPKLAQ